MCHTPPGSEPAFHLKQYLQFTSCDRRWGNTTNSRPGRFAVPVLAGVAATDLCLTFRSAGCYLNLQILWMKVWFHSLLLVKSQCILLKTWFYIIVFACGNRMFCWISILVSWRTMFVNKTSCLVGSRYLVNNMFCLAITHITHLDLDARFFAGWIPTLLLLQNYPLVY